MGFKLGQTTSLMVSAMQVCEVWDVCYNVTESVSSERVISCLHSIISSASEIYALFVFGLNCIEFKNES